jgi:hypothetical protein
MKQLYSLKQHKKSYQLGKIIKVNIILGNKEPAVSGKNVFFLFFCWK